MREPESGFAAPTQRAGARRAAYAFSLFGLIAMASLSFASPRAYAADVHVLDLNFSVASKTTSPNSIAVDEQTGSIYVMSMGGATPGGDILKFDATGTPENFSALGTNVLNTPCEFSCRSIAVDNSGSVNQGVIYVSRANSGSSAEISVYLPSGEQVASIKGRSLPATTSAFCGVAVDGNGSVFASHSGFSESERFVDEFQPLEWATNPAQEPTPTATISPLNITPCKMGVDSTRSLAIKTGTGSTSTGTVYRFPGSAFGPPEAPFSGGVGTEIAGSNAREVATDLSNDDVYVTGGDEVLRFDPSDSQLEHFGAEQLTTSAQGIAVHSANGTVYVSDFSTDEVFVYEEIEAAVPTVNPATEVLQFTADVSGAVDPDGAGEVIDCQFEYVGDQSFQVSGFATAEQEPCEQATPYAAPQAVSAELTGLNTETTYHYRLAATNSNGTNVSGSESLTTHAVQDLVTEAATGVGPREATLNASFTGIGESTDYHFQYGTSTLYDQKTPIENAGETTGFTPLTAEIANLELETTYHYRIVAENSSGTSFGEDMTFPTHAAVAGVTTQSASDISQNGITLHGEFEGNGEPTSYYFEYGPTTAYGMTSEEAPGADAGEPIGPMTVSSIIDEFEGYTTYHFRLVAVNSFGETRGADETFTSLPAPLPAVISTSVSGIGETSATIGAVLNPNRWPTIYLFEYGTSSVYESWTYPNDVLGGLDNGAHPVSAELIGLKPGATYHFRVTATNFTGTTHSADQRFTTARPPEGVAPPQGLAAAPPGVISSPGTNSQDCRVTRRRAKKKRAQARRLWKRTIRASNPVRRRSLRKKASKVTRQAHRLGAQAKKCERSAKRGGS